MKRRLYTYPLLWLLFITCNVLNAQDSSQCFDISKVIYANSLSRYTQSTFIQKNEILPEQLPALSFRDGLVYSGTIPGRDVTKKAILRFSVCNTADTAISVWFFPGFFYSDISIYHEVNGRLAPLPVVSPEVVDNVGYRQIRLDGHDTARIYAELEFVRTHINTLRPRLIHAERIDSFIKDLQESHRINNMVTFVFSGLLLMLILFSLVSFFQGANRDYLYYAAYAFFVGAMLFTKAFYDRRPNAVGYFFEGYFDYIMQSLGIIFYMLFMRGFLNTRTRHPFLYHLYNFGVVMLLVSMTAFTYLHYFTPHFTSENAVENISKFVLLLMTIIFLVYSLRKWDDKLLRYVFWGNLFLFVFSLFSLVLSLNANNITLPGIWDSSLLYYEIGLFLELVFFLMGLNYKNLKQIIRQTKERERLKRENQMKEYEKELAVYKAQQEERQRISTDMHDELGAGMTAIRLMSEIARNKMKESTPVEIERISHSADEVLNKMNAIIWSMNSGNDTLDNLVSYIRSYALEYFDGTQVECRVNTPVSIDNREITGDKRRNIFLCVKETLNNSLKHSGANLVTIDFTINEHLTIEIKDNGSGIDMDKLRQFGNGLKNIARRMKSIGGTFNIQKDNGTVTTLTLPI
jgi:signal transduction histidine kinase